MITSRLYSTARAASAAPAAPAGGGPIAGCRGCGFPLISAAIFALTGCVLPLAANSQTTDEFFTVPSGQAVKLAEVLQDETLGELWLRFRFIAPKIAHKEASFEINRMTADMDHLCDTVALSYVRDHQLHPERIAISMSDRLVPFGDADPSATQFFELYSLDAATCIWEAF